MPPPGTHDLLTAWWLPAALLLPPEYALLGPVPIGAYAHRRARQGPLYWRAFTAAALGLAGAASSLLFHSLFRAWSTRTARGCATRKWSSVPRAAPGCSCSSTRS